MSIVREDSNIKTALIPRQDSEKILKSSSLGSDLIQTIGDNSFPYLRSKNLYDIVVQITLKLPIIRPENKWLLAWHSIVLIACLYYIFQIGLLWGYGIAVWEDQLAVLYVLNFFFIIVLIIDCFVTNIKAYYSHGLLVTNRRLIVKRYLKVRFYIDVISIVSITIPFISSNFALNWIKALFFLKIYTVYEIDKQFIRVSQLKIKYHTFYLLCRLILFLYLGSHYLGIWFYMVDHWVYTNNYYGPNTPNICWIYNAQAYSQLVLLQPWYGQYLYTMYFSIGTMTTIAYGDITPLNPLQVLYITIALIPYTIGFAYILSEILRILMEAQAYKFEHSNNLLIVSNMMKNNRIKQKTQSKVKSYFQKVWKEEIYRNREVEAELIQKLPHKIRNQLYSQLYYSFFSVIDLYYIGSERAVKSNFVVALANQIKEQRLVQDHIVYKEDQEFDPDNLNNHVFYFVKELIKGKLKPSIQIGVKDLVIKTIAEGNFGIQGFYTGDPRDHWAKIILSVLVYQLPRKALIDNLHLAQQIELQNIYIVTSDVYNRSCYICKQKGHSFKKCKYVTYQPNVNQLVKFYLANPNKRFHLNDLNLLKQNSQKRKPRVSFNSLIIHKEINSIKFKIKSKNQLMAHSNYYRMLFNKKKNKEKKCSEKKDDFSIKTDSMSRTFSKKNANKLTGRVDEKKPSFYEKKESKFEDLLDQKIEQSPKMQEKNEKESELYKKIHKFQSLTPQNIQQLDKRSQTSQQTSLDSSQEDQQVDVQNYIKQTELFIREIEKMETNDKQKKESIYDNQIEYDVAKQFSLYNVLGNAKQVIKKFNNPFKSQNQQRRKAQTHYFNHNGRQMQDIKKVSQTHRNLLINDEQNYMIKSNRSYSMKDESMIQDP